VDPETWDLTRDAAQTLLQLDSDLADRRSMDGLAEKAGDGRLSPREREDAETS